MYTVTMTQLTDRPIGSLKASPLVARTEDVLAFLDGRFTATGLTQASLAERTGISLESAKKILNNERVAVALEVVDDIVTALGQATALGTEVPLYRAPHMSEKEYLRFMRKALNDELRNPIVDDEWALSIPEFP